jgi:hypothetical protein
MAFQFDAQNKKHDIIFILETNFHQIKNASAKELIQNIAEYQIGKLNTMGYDVMISLAEDSTLAKAVDKYDYAVVYSADTEFQGGAFFKHLHKLIEQDFYIAGHILDRKEGYYELHEQCYVINLKKHKEFECPPIGEMKRDAKHFTSEPIRSEENFHDDYTPLWIKPGTELKNYTHKWHGWNIITVALDNKENIIVFDEDIRLSKRCYYAKHETDFIEHSKQIYKKYNQSANRLFYPINTEELQTISIAGNIKQLIIPASGFNWLKYLEKYGYDEDTEVIFYDYNPNALFYMEETIKNFDGGDYHKFLKSKNRHKTPDWLNSKLEIAEHFQTISHLWHIKSKIKFKFIECDLLNEFTIKPKNHSNVILHISNIFGYEPTVPFVPTKQRIMQQNQLIKHLKEKYNKIQLIVSQHAWAGFVEYDIDAGPIEKFYEVDLESLKAPMWRFGTEWKTPKDSMEEHDEE